MYHKHEHCLPCLARARLLFGIYLPVRRISWYFWYLIWETTRLQCRIPRFDSWVRKIPWKRDRLPTLVFTGFPGGSAGKESACNAGDLGLISGLGRAPGGGHGNPLQYSCLENPHGQRSLVDYSPWGFKELVTTEHLSTAHSLGDS